MSTHQRTRGVIYIAKSPLCERAVIGHGYHIESIKNSLKNFNNPGRTTYSAGRLIRDNGGIDSWNFIIISDKIYDKKRDLLKDFKAKYQLILNRYNWIQIDNANMYPQNHELVELNC